MIIGMDFSAELLIGPHKGQKVKNLCGLHIDFGEFTTMV